jgi:hypothetical protein
MPREQLLARTGHLEPLTTVEIGDAHFLARAVAFMEGAERELLLGDRGHDKCVTHADDPVMPSDHRQP